jgi:hypothetical protein
VAFWSTSFDVEDTIQTSTFGSLLPILRTFRNMKCDHFYVTLLTPRRCTRVIRSERLVHLAEPTELGSNDKWEVGVTEITYSPKNVGIFRSSIIVGDTVSLMYCDLISPQFVGGSLARVLRTFTTPTMSG